MPTKNFLNFFAFPLAFFFGCVCPRLSRSGAGGCYVGSFSFSLFLVRFALHCRWFSVASLCKVGSGKIRSWVCASKFLLLAQVFRRLWAFWLGVGGLCAAEF